MVKPHVRVTPSLKRPLALAPLKPNVRQQFGTAMIVLTVLTGVLIAAVLCYAEPKHPVEIKKGFLTGNSFRELSYAGKRGYAMGFLDGAFMSPIFDAPKKELRWIETCVVGMTDEQVVAILDKFLANNPARWHEQMNILAWAAMKEGCPR